MTYKMRINDYDSPIGFIACYQFWKNFIYELEDEFDGFAFDSRDWQDVVRDALLEANCKIIHGPDYEIDHLEFETKEDAMLFKLRYT